MRLTPEKLQQNFTLHEKVDASNFNAFIKKQGWKSYKWRILFWSLILIFIVITASLILATNKPILQRLAFAALGILIASLLVPFHEFIHFLMYKLFGARDVSLSFYPRKGYALTRANRFVVNGREMKWIALAPFFIISSSGMLLLFFWDDVWKIAVSAMILFHATLCHADFLIVDYLLEDDAEILMYDDVEEGVTHIYRR